MVVGNFRLWLVVVGCDGFILGGDGWWWVFFERWLVVVDGGGFWWVMAQFIITRSNDLSFGN